MSTQGSIILPGSGHDDAHEHLPVYPDHTGELRVLGNLRTPADRVMKFGAPLQLIPESQWQEFQLDFTTTYPYKIKDQNGKGACLVAGTMIRLADGSQIPIESIQVGDLVRTAKWNAKNVVRLFAREVDESLCYIKTTTHDSAGTPDSATLLKITGNHRLMTPDGYVPAEDIKTGDRLSSGHLLYRTVETVERFPFKGTVYNFEVADDHSYNANGVHAANCNGHAAASSLEIARIIEGQDYEELSAWMVYATLCNGRDVGSNIGDALNFLSTTGTCLDANVPYGTINPRVLTAANKTEAARYKIELGTPLTTFAELMSATQLRRPFNFSIHVGNGFDQLDSDGCPRASGGFGNHAVTGGLGAKRGKNGKWLIYWANSWSVKWGLNGFAYFSEDHIRGQGGFESYDVRVPTWDGGGVNPPAVA